MAPCEADISYDGDFAIIKLSGTLEYGNVISVSANGKIVLDNGYKKIIIDMTKITYANSKGLGSLISIMRQCAEKNAKLVLLNPNGKALEVLTTTKLHTVFPFVEKGTLNDAKNNFK